MFCTGLKTKPHISQLKKIPIGAIICRLPGLRVDLPSPKVIGTVKGDVWTKVDVMLAEWKEWDHKS